MCRRNSESHNYDVNRSHTSLHKIQSQSRRQLSAASEPDSLELRKSLFSSLLPCTRLDFDCLLFAAPSVKAGPGKSSARNMLLQFHTEYTSITDELESVCHMLVSPTSTVSLDKPRNELSKHEFAAMIEKQHLKECEDDDYEIMKRLLVARESIEATDDSLEVLSLDITTRKVLKRDSAFEMPVTPSKSFGFAEESEEPASRLSRNLSADPPYSRQNAPSNLLNPRQMDEKLLRKSMDSLAKNSSSDTEYSMHPYKVIKQSSNETTTSMTGSFNVENASEHGDSNQTVIENPMADQQQQPQTRQRAMSARSGNPLKLGAAFLRKQFSTEKSHRIDPESSMQFTKSQTAITEDGAAGVEYHSEGGNKPLMSIHLITAGKKLATDSSSSTEDGRVVEELTRRTIPNINTEVVQDEIAKLSSNIKSSTEEEKEPKNNETMC